MRYVLALMLVAAACSTTTTTTEVSTGPIGTLATTSTAASVPPTSTVAETPATTPLGETVTFRSGDLDMIGTLRIPADGQPVPAVVLIHGSGPASRDATLTGQLNMMFGFEIPVFAEVARGLQEAGIGVLTYDKRTCGTFNGCSENGYPLPGDDFSVDTFIEDAQAAVEYLRTRSEVDPGRISILGHSQGAQFITLMLEADPRLESGVMVAGAYRPIDEIVQYQLDFTIDLLGQMGVSEEDAMASPGVASFADFVDDVAAIRAGGDEAAGGTSADFWRSWFDLHERSLSSTFRITQPVLVMNGDLDWNVPVSEAEAWSRFLAEAGAEHALAVLPCVTHALNCVTESDPAAMQPDDIGDEVDPQVIRTLVAFLTG